MKLKRQYDEQQKEAQRLAVLDETKSNFFANISHEFRTPLTLILAYINKLKSAENGNDAHVSLSIMERNASRVLHLVNQLLDLSKIEAGTLHLKYKKYSFHKVVKYNASQFTSLAEMKNIDFQISCDEPVELYFDLEKIEMIINNLLSNAIKFSSERGKVHMTLSAGQANKNYEFGYAKLSVSDNGPGISTDEQEQIFTRFYQANISSTRKYEGAGIGLSVSRELASLHHGEIVVKSQEGQGSTFTLKLPLGSAHLENVDDALVEFQKDLPRPEEIPKNHDGDGNFDPDDHKEKPYVLVVEDNEDLRKYLEENLRPHFQVKLAVNGKFGHELALETIPDLIVSDLMMPDMDGYALCEKIKTDEKTSHIPFMLLTAKSDQATKIDSFKIGADAYLLKPFDFDELNARISNLIRSREKLKDTYTKQIYLRPRNTTVQSLDEKFLARAVSILENQYPDPSFSVQLFAQEMAVSEVQLFRKMKALTGHSPNEVIRNYRLLKAADLLKQHAGNITDVAYSVGFSSLSYFAKCFKEKFECTPKEFSRNSLNQ